MKMTIPKSTILDNGKEVSIYVEMSGVQKEDLDIKVDGEVLTVQGNANYSIKEDQKSIHQEFLEKETHKRQFILTNKIDKDSIIAHLENGILKISLSKTKESQTKKIQVH